MPKKTPQNPTEALAAKLAAEGVIEIESRLYSILAPALAANIRAALDDYPVISDQHVERFRSDATIGAYLAHFEQLTSR